MTEQEVIELQKVVEQEIRDHGIVWCRSSCNTFDAEAYRRYRIVYQRTKLAVQNDIRACHAPR